MAKKGRERAGLDLHILLDASGSMSSRKGPVIKAFNAFIDALQYAAVPPIVTVSLYKGVSGVIKLADAKPLNEVPKLTQETYRCGGGTPTHSAVRATVEDLKASPSTAKALMIVTDGAASDYDSGGTNDRITEARKNGWMVLLLAMGGIEAADMAREYGIHPHNAVQVVRMTDDEMGSAMMKAAVATLNLVSHDGKEEVTAF